LGVIEPCLVSVGVGKDDVNSGDDDDISRMADDDDDGSIWITDDEDEDDDDDENDDEKYGLDWVFLLIVCVCTAVGVVFFVGMSVLAGTSWLVRGLWLLGCVVRVGLGLLCVAAHIAA
jgi:hypothetical protein